MILPAILLTLVGQAPPNAPPPSGSQAPLPQRELIAALIEALGDPDGVTRQNVAYAIANLGNAAVPGLLEALQNEKPERRSGAAMALGQVRPVARQAIPALVNALKDKDEGVRRQASYALSRLVNRDVYPTLSTPGGAANGIPPIEPTPARAPFREAP